MSAGQVLGLIQVALHARIVKLGKHLGKLAQWMRQPASCAMQDTMQTLQGLWCAPGVTVVLFQCKDQATAKCASQASMASSSLDFMTAHALAALLDNSVHLMAHVTARTVLEDSSKTCNPRQCVKRA